MFRFAHPEFFQLFWLVLGFLVVRAIVLRRLKKKTTGVFPERIWKFLAQHNSPARNRWKMIFATIGMFFLIIALARPQAGSAAKEVSREGIELILAIDVSNSMLTEDIRPSRLSVARKNSQRLLEMLTGHKIGLVAFAGNAVLVSPLTVDHSAIKLFLDSLTSDTVSSQGTNLGRALAVSQRAFQSGGVEKNKLTAVTRAIVLMSDGEDNEEGLQDAIEVLRKDNVFVFTVGLGTEKGERIPMRDEDGQLKGYKKDRSGNLVITKLEDSALKMVARKTDGEFFVATAMGKETGALFQRLESLEKAQFESDMAVDYDEKYQIPLFFAFVFLLLEVWMQRRKRGRGLWLGRFEPQL
jgi:Ca-activated chloride channel family protein